MDDAKHDPSGGHTGGQKLFLESYKKLGGDAYDEKRRREFLKDSASASSRKLSKARRTGFQLLSRKSRIIQQRCESSIFVTIFWKNALLLYTFLAFHKVDRGADVCA